MCHVPLFTDITGADQWRAGRTQILTTTFEEYEDHARDQLTQALSSEGFDADLDIEAITVNRWPHGYSYTYNTLDEPWDWVFTSSDERPCVVGRQPYGKITIANADAAASPHTDASILEAHRAIEEVMSFI